MKKFLENLANLLKVKTMVTIVVMIVFAVLSLTGQIASDKVMLIVTAVIAFYFGTVNERNSGGDDR